MPGKRGTYACKKHGQEFKRPNVCPLCTPADAEAVVERTEASELAAEAMKRGLPSMLDHEKNFGELEKLWRKREASAHKKGKGATAAMYGNLVMKAANARTAITEWREDWIRTEREAADARGDYRPPTSAPADGKSARSMH